MVDVHTVLDAIRGDCELPPRSHLNTFDDAYTDLAEHAWPTLLEYEIPAVLFVPTAYPDSQQVFWWDRLQQVAHESGVLDTAEGRHRFRKFIQHVKSLPHSETLACVDDYCESHNALPAKSHVLTWEQLRKLASEGLDLAAHTRTHPLLTRVHPEEAVQQAVLSRDDLREQTGIGLPVFAYPGGAHSVGLSKLLAEAGFKVAFTTQRGVNDLNSVDPLLLRRINVSVTTPRAVVRAQLLATMRHLDPLWKV